MNNDTVAIVGFTDAGTEGEAFVLVRQGTDAVGLTLSHKDDGDLAVFMPIATFKDLIRALQQAVELVSAPPNFKRST